jgi:hypothetical protein
MSIKSCVVFFQDTVGDDDADYVANIDGGDAKQLLIPSYQRPFKWSKSHFEELWQDTIEAIEANEDEYYLGPVGIFDDSEDYGLSVVDGQQRYTAVTILSVALRDYCINEGFFKSAWNINNILLWTDHTGTLKERLISGFNSSKKDRVNQNSTQLSTLLRWPHKTAGCRKNPPDIIPTVLQIIGNNTEPGQPIAIGHSTDVKLLIPKLTHTLKRTSEFVFEGNTVTLVDVGGDSDIEVTVYGNNENVEIDVTIRNTGPDSITIGCESEPIYNEFENDKQWLDAEHGGKRPNKSERMFLRHYESYKLIEEKIETFRDRDEKIEFIDKIFRIFSKYKFTITLFPTLETALAYFEKINDSKFSEPLNVHDLINYSIEKISSEGLKQSVKHDKTLKKGEKIKDYVGLINKYWAAIEETLQPPEIKKKKEASKVIGDFFHTFLLSYGKRWGKKKTLPKVKEILSQLTISEHKFNKMNEDEVQKVFFELANSLDWIHGLSQTYSLVAMPNKNEPKQIRLNNIFRVYQQHRSLLVTAIDEIRGAASVHNANIDFEDDSDYKTKAPDYHRLEEKFIELIEFHLARNVILRHENDTGFSSHDWWGEIEKWNKAILWRQKDYNKKTGFSVSDIESILGKIEDGGTVRVQPPEYDGGGKLTGMSSTVEDLELTGLRSITIRTTPNFIENGRIHEDIRNMRLDKSHGTFLLYIIETVLRSQYSVPSGHWQQIEINSEQSLEHILPQSAHSSNSLPLEEWPWWAPGEEINPDTGADYNIESTDEIKNYVERLGNMCLVKKKYNSSYGNKGFEHKQITGNPDDYPSLTSLTNAWESIIDLKTDADTNLLKTKDPFSDAKLGLPCHHATLPISEWTKETIDHRNDWLFDILAQILAGKEELHQIKLRKYKEKISQIDETIFQRLDEAILAELETTSEEPIENWNEHFSEIMNRHEIVIPEFEPEEVGDDNHEVLEPIIEPAAEGLELVDDDGNQI